MGVILYLNFDVVHGLLGQIVGTVRDELDLADAAHQSLTGSYTYVKSMFDEWFAAYLDKMAEVLQEWLFEWLDEAKVIWTAVATTDPNREVVLGMGRRRDRNRRHRHGLD